MPCTGGWDWAPISNTEITSKATGTARTFSLGIWKSVWIQGISHNDVSIEHLVPSQRYLGQYPTAPLEDGNHAGFVVDVTLHGWVGKGGAGGHFRVRGEWGPTVTTKRLVLQEGRFQTSVAMQAPASEVKLWWPNGVGDQFLYNITAEWVPDYIGSGPLGQSDAPRDAASAAGGDSLTRQMGFRVAALVTVNDTDPEVVRVNGTADGSGTFGMFFRVNGAPLFARGANLVPMEEMEARMHDTAVRQLVDSSADAGMNMIRVWGGGIYPSDAFYEQCDARGILLYHDLMFAGAGHSAINVSHTTLVAEVQHQVRRLASHPSILLYDGANEVIVNRTGPTAVYADVVLTTVAREDPSRILWPASPAAGWLSGVNRLYGAPAENQSAPLVALVGKHAHIWDAGNERHGPYEAGYSTFGAVCNDPWSQALHYDPQMPMKSLYPGRTGVQEKSIFTSEFGVAVMSSFESMAPTLSPRHWSLHGGDAPPDKCGDAIVERQCNGTNPMAQRNWVCDNMIWSVFGPARINSTGGERNFQAQLYQCLVAQALTLKQRIEAMRITNTLGMLVWQLNDIWPTGSWGSLEYGTASNLTAGQVVGGRWKPVHHLYDASLMRDVFASCGVLHNGTNACFVRSDRAGVAFQGSVTFTTVDLATGEQQPWLERKQMQMAPGPAGMEWLPAPGGLLPNGNTTALIAEVLNEDGTTVESNHVVLLAPPSTMQLSHNVSVQAEVGAAPGRSGRIPVTVSASGKGVAAFVTLTTAAQGRFSRNVFLLRPQAPLELDFIPFGDAAEAHRQLNASLRVEHAAMYM